MKCLTCDRFGNGPRQLCMTHYNHLARCVKAGATTWAELIVQGKATEAQAKVPAWRKRGT